MYKFYSVLIVICYKRDLRISRDGPLELQASRLAEGEVLAQRDSAQSPHWSMSGASSVALVLRACSGGCSNPSYAVVDVLLFMVFENVVDVQLGAGSTICLLHELLNSTLLETEALMHRVAALRAAKSFGQ
jgi:hypothetical protein